MAPSRDLRAKLTAADAAQGEQLGSAVAIRGATVMARAPEADAGGTDAGPAYLLARNHLGVAGGWGQVARLAAADAAQGEQLGSAVAVGPGTVTVSAPSADAAAGAGYRFARNEGGTDAWGQVSRLTAASGVAGDQWGRALTAAGGTLLVGGPGRAPAAGAYVFRILQFTTSCGPAHGD